jgi:hypothetical protein
MPDGVERLHLLIEIALASWKIEVVTLAEAPQNRLDIDGELERLKCISTEYLAKVGIGNPDKFNKATCSIGIRSESDGVWINRSRGKNPNQQGLTLGIAFVATEEPALGTGLWPGPTIDNYIFKSSSGPSRRSSRSLSIL